MGFSFGGEWPRWNAVKASVLGSDRETASIGDVAELSEKLAAINQRIDGIKLIAVDQGGSLEYGCGGTQTTTPSSLVVMHGLRDGTSCGTTNINYLKEIQIVVPE